MIWTYNENSFKILKTFESRILIEVFKKKKLFFVWNFGNEVSIRTSLLVIF